MNEEPKAVTPGVGPPPVGEVEWVEDGVLANVLACSQVNLLIPFGGVVTATGFATSVSVMVRTLEPPPPPAQQPRWLEDNQEITHVAGSLSLGMAFLTAGEVAALPCAEEFIHALADAVTAKWQANQVSPVPAINPLVHV